MAPKGLFGLYVPSAVKPVSGLVMEHFPSRDVCASALKKRNETGTSHLFTDRAKGYVSLSARPFMTWPVFDETGYMRVWTAWTGDDWPGPLSRPDEEWIVTESGKVERIPWTDAETEPLYLANGGAWVNSRLIK
jgi:hypothetical protein